MKIACVLTALLLVLPPTGVAFPGRAAARQQSANSPPAEVTPGGGLLPEGARVAEAQAKYQQGRAVEAALGFEGLWKDYPTNLDHLFNAALSRFSAGHYAHAVARLREYLAQPNIKDEERQAAEKQLRAALPEVSPVMVTVTTEAGGPDGITVVAQYMARDSSDLRSELPFPATAGIPKELELDPGSWIVRAQGPGYVTVEQRVDVATGAKAAVSLHLGLNPAPNTVVPFAPASPAEVPPKLVRRLELGFGIAGGLAAVTGIAVLAVGAGNIRNTTECADKTFKTCVQDLRNGVRVRDIGVMALGGGVGLLTGGLTWLSKDPRKRRAAWVGEVVVGGVALVTGAILTTVSAGNFNSANNTADIDLWSTHFEAHRHSVGHATGNFLFGMGAGLITSAATGLAVQKKHLGKDLRVDPMAGRGQAGLMISGRF